MNGFTEAMHHFVQESIAYDRVTGGEYQSQRASDIEASGRALTQAGDVLESEVRRMIRGERGDRPEDWLKGGGMVSQPRWPHI